MWFILMVFVIWKVYGNRPQTIPESRVEGRDPSNTDWQHRVRREFLWVGNAENFKDCTIYLNQFYLLNTNTMKIVKFYKIYMSYSNFQLFENPLNPPHLSKMHVQYL